MQETTICILPQDLQRMGTSLRKHLMDFPNELQRNINIEVA
jgi:hypothetical protein